MSVPDGAREQAALAGSGPEGREYLFVIYRTDGGPDDPYEALKALYASQTEENLIESLAQVDPARLVRDLADAGYDVNTEE